MQRFGDLNTRTLYGLGYAAALLVLGALGGIFLWLGLALAFGLCVGEAQRMLKDETQTLQTLAIVVLGLVFLSLGVLRGYFGLWTLVGFFIATFIFDTASYMGGRYFGGAKLVPSISPGKTRSGFYCGLGALMLFSPFLIPATGIWVRYLFALILGFGFLAGDLLVSYLKRRAGLKDTGNLIPGHGGILDRMDSFVVAAPLYWMLQLSDPHIYA